MKRLMIIKASWKQLFESLLTAFSIICLSFLVLRFLIALIFLLIGRSALKYEYFETVVLILAIVIFIITYYLGFAETKVLMNDIILNRTKQIDAIYISSVKTKIFITNVNRLNLKINNKKYINICSKTPLDIETGTKINVSYAEKSLILVSWHILM